ncbi:receptor-like protein 6 [Brassica napus]|uniref:receptor-like protein 6 n=1 Tax=Brassica napus TaxID=3708 RepID=UPI0006AB67AE|nr:receptor-like protein 6 [Brassica napus]
MIGTIFLLFFSISSSSYTYASLTLCRPDQRDALLEFKSEFNDEGIQGAWTSFCVTSSPKRKSWENNTDCCYWDGITCDANSGVVIGVDLSSSCLHGHFKPNSSLFRLQYLRSLNLAYNDFNASSIPTRINELMGLQRLNLSYTSFSGEIPTEILHLTKLVSLDLSSIFMYSQTLSSPGKPFLSQLAQNLTNLRQLDLSHVNLSSEMPQMMISNLTSLRSIRLHGCNLFGRFPRLSPTIRSIDLSVNPHLESSLPEFNGSNSLVYLDVTDTSLSGSIPEYSISNLKHLKVLSFSDCKFTGKIPSSIGNLSHLNILDFGYNNLAGEIPTALFNLTKLSSLSLASNHFTGTLPHNINSLSNLNIFNAASNSFFGTVPSTFFNIPCLESLDLGDNHFSGPLEIGNISSMSKLQSLVLSKNNLTGPIPTSISKLVNLVYLDLSYLNTRGPLDVGIFWHLKSLQQLTLSHINTTIARIDLNAVLSLPLKSLSILDLSGSHVSVENMSSSVSTLSSQLIYLFLSGCGITVFPEFISSLQYISMIDLSNNSIKGQVPAWLWRLPELHYAELSYNAINGFKEFPKDVSRTMMSSLFLNKNNLSRENPRAICDMASLSVVDLSNNNFSGSVPQCLSNLIKRGR